MNKLTKEEIGVILSLMDEKIESANKNENEHYNQALVTAYKKLMREERE